MTVLVNLLGSPSSGKSTTAAKLFTKFKDWDLNVEYSMEVVKLWCYEGKKVDKYCQYMLFGSECYNRSRMFGTTDIVVSDSPVMLTGFYNHYYNGDSSLSEACKGFYKKTAEDGIKVLNLFLPRTRGYNPVGRYQTQEQADIIAIKLKEWLGSEGYDYTVLDCPDEQRIDIIIDRLRVLTNGFKEFRDDSKN